MNLISLKVMYVIVLGIYLEIVSIMMIATTQLIAKNARVSIKMAPLTILIIQILFMKN